MKNTITMFRIMTGFLGRLALFCLGGIILEGIVTLGHAFDFNNYHPLAWVAQGLFFVVLVWAALELTFESLELNN